MNVAPDQQNILGELIILDNRYKFIFIQFHLSIFLSFTGGNWAVVLDDFR